MADKNINQDISDKLNQIYDNNVIFIKTDVSKEKDVRHLFTKVIDFCDGVDCIINNEGIIAHGLLHKVDENTWDDVMNTDVKSIFYTTKYFIPDIMIKGWGTVVNTSSISGIEGDLKCRFIMLLKELL